MSELIDETMDEMEDEPMFDPIDESSDITWFEDPPSGPTPDWYRPWMTKIGVGRCTARSLGIGGSRPLGSLGGPSKSGGSVGSWRVGADRPRSSWRWTVGPS
jgi:hypothetical protein